MADDLLQKFTPFLESLTLTPSGGGRFEVTLNDDLIYSKKSLGRHAEPGEVAKLFEEKTGFKPITEAG